MHVDEYVLAAYLSGELKESDRNDVTESLISDRSLREWLHMASDAQAAAAGEQDEGPNMRLLSTKDPVFPGVYNGDRAAKPAHSSNRRAV